MIPKRDSCWDAIRNLKNLRDRVVRRAAHLGPPRKEHFSFRNTFLVVTKRKKNCYRPKQNDRNFPAESSYFRHRKFAISPTRRIARKGSQANAHTFGIIQNRQSEASTDRKYRQMHQSVCAQGTVKSVKPFEASKARRRARGSFEEKMVRKHSKQPSCFSKGSNPRLCNNTNLHQPFESIRSPRPHSGRGKGKYLSTRSVLKRPKSLEKRPSLCSSPR